MWKRQDDLIARLTIRGYLVLLTLAIMVPVLIFATILYFGYYNSELSRIETDLQSDARQLALTIDRDVAGLQYTAQTLATATRIQDRDYAGFYEQAQRVRSFAGVNVLLRELNGQQVVNTRVEYGAPLPLEPLAGDQQVLSTRRPLISGVIVGAVARQHVFTITVPIVHDDQVTHFLNLSLPVSRLVNLIQENLVTGRRAGIVDNAGLIMARSERFQELVGQPAARDFVAQARKESRRLGRDQHQRRGRAHRVGDRPDVRLDHLCVASRERDPRLAARGILGGDGARRGADHRGVAARLCGGRAARRLDACALGRGRAARARRTGRGAHASGGGDQRDRRRDRDGIGRARATRTRARQGDRRICAACRIRSRRWSRTAPTNWSTK